MTEIDQNKKASTKVDMKMSITGREHFAIVTISSKEEEQVKSKLHS